jgi:PAS domain S-box-containing protein
VEWTLRTVRDGNRGNVGELVVRIVERRRSADGDLRTLISAVEMSTDAAYVYRRRAGEEFPSVQYANRAAEFQCGYSRKELASESRFGPLTDRGEIARLIGATERGDPLRLRLRHYRRDGSSYWSDVQARPLGESPTGELRWLSIERIVTEEVDRERALQLEVDAYATLAATAAAFIDANDLGQLEQMYREARQRLVASARREAAGVLDGMYQSAFRRLRLYEESVKQHLETTQTQAEQADAMALLAHDIRGPLNTMLGFTELIQEVSQDRPEVSEYVRFVLRAGNRVIDLCNEIMVAAQLERNEYKPGVEQFDLLALIENVVSLLPGGDRAMFFFPGATLTMEADLSGLRHIIGNLASNALKYSSSSSRVEISVERSDDEVKIVVRDYGIGIPASDLPMIFERYVRAENARRSAIRGTGLGLYFVKQLVDRMAGTIEVTSQQNEGTTVTLHVPLRPLGSFELPEIVSLESVGDERSLVANQLRRRGYPVRVAQTPTQAEAMVQREGVGLLIIDTDAFPLDSVELVRGLCQAQNVPLIACGSAEHNEAADGVERLRTPFVGEELVAKVEALLPLFR